MSDYLDPNNEELLKDFFSEAYGQVESLEQNILALEQDTGKPRRSRRDIQGCPHAERRGPAPFR